MTEIPEKPIKKYMKLSSSDDLSGYWIDAYGWIACYFAQLEGLSYAIIEMLANQRDQARLKRMKYQDRTEEAKNLVCRRLIERGEESLAEEWDALLMEAKAAAPMRNDILHNPLHVNLALGNPLSDEDVGISVNRNGRSSTIKLGAVQEFANLMLELNKRMQDLLTRSQLTDQWGRSH